MTTLERNIRNAKTDQELETVILNIPKQSNGERTQLYRVLDDSFWYVDLNTTEKKVAFMLKRLPHYER